MKFDDEKILFFRYENCWATSVDTVHWKGQGLLIRLDLFQNPGKKVAKLFKDVNVRNCNDALKHLETILVQFHNHWFSTASLTPLLVEYNCASAQFCIPGSIPSFVLPVDEFNSTTLTNNCQAGILQILFIQFNFLQLLQARQRQVRRI